mmetsp:Transcript_7348/g.18425  ORF Transcript_7348/g.18425 Transcript_7348/m.18425 type:complete len:292 (+) Transcript_7348:400-1275(+)
MLWAAADIFHVASATHLKGFGDVGRRDAYGEGIDGYRELLDGCRAADAHTVRRSRPHCLAPRSHEPHLDRCQHCDFSQSDKPCRGMAQHDRAGLHRLLGFGRSRRGEARCVRTPHRQDDDYNKLPADICVGVPRLVRSRTQSYDHSDDLGCDQLRIHYVQERRPHVPVTASRLEVVSACAENCAGYTSQPQARTTSSIAVQAAGVAFEALVSDGVQACRWRSSDQFGAGAILHVIYAELIAECLHTCAVARHLVCALHRMLHSKASVENLSSFHQLQDRLRCGEVSSIRDS